MAVLTNGLLQGARAREADYTPRAQAIPGTAALVNAVAKGSSDIGYGGAPGDEGGYFPIK